MPYLQRGDASLYYEEYGAGYPVLVLAPGSLNSTIEAWHRSRWDPTRELASEYRVIAMDQRLDFSPGDKPDVAKTATLELTPKQSEIITLAVKMGDLSLALRSLQDPDEKPDEASENAAAEPGDSFTEDAQVSRLIKPMVGNAATQDQAKPQVFVLRGSTRTKQDIEGSTISESAPKEDKQINATPFTRTISSEPQK